ncbi:MBL fold metallo-hydrolase [Phnomibacter sp. MR]|uniref:MBL fold metallo-hydrolase n=1 Tax=Phnomibacter sp. MR TaxID=3042318 RepID=UPI003A8011B0
MYIQQLYTSCLSEAAYYIESNGEAAIIDPLRDYQTYTQLAAERKASIKYIFETHFHADFVSGHIDLSKATGAPIVYGPGTQTRYPIHIAKDGETFSLGELTIEALHTPGHTLESTCWLLRKADGAAHAVFTGDTLFIGDVGRPDLSSGNLGSEELAGMLYDSLHNKLATLPDDVLVYPAHGAGSACGKNLGPETFSTIGEQKASNYALQTMEKEIFVVAVTTGLKEAPAYFATNAAINQKGYTAFEEVLAKGMKALTVAEVETLLEDDNTIVLDTRAATVFTNGFIPGSVSIGLEGRFAEWAASLLPFNQQLLLITDPGKEEESVTRLARVGFEQFAGHLAGGFNSWVNAGKQLDIVIDIEPDELAMDLPHDDKLLVVDVRNEVEFSEGHIVGATHLALSEMNDTMRIATLPEEANIYLHCAAGYRSVIAASLIKRQGLHNVRNVLGGFTAISEIKEIPTEKDTAALS